MLTRKSGYLAPFNGVAPAASDQLERLGYALVPGILDASEIAGLATEIERVYREFPADGRGAASRTAEVDEEFRYEMLNRSPLCQKLAGHRALLDVIEPLLGEDCHVIANTCWRNPPVGGQGHTPGEQHGGGFWHIDAGPHIPRPKGVSWPETIPYPIFAIGVHVFLQDCPLECGPTGVIAGSHTSGQAPPRNRYNDASLSWNGQTVTPLPANKGDAALFVSDVWHRRLPSMEGDTGRFFVQFHYGRRDIAQRLRTTAEVNHLSAEALGRVDGTREAQLLGIHAPRFYDG